MSETITFIQNHYDEFLAIIGGIISIATIIVKLTPTIKDDTILNKIISILSKFSVINTKSDQEKIDNAK